MKAPMTAMDVQSPAHLQEPLPPADRTDTDIAIYRGLSWPQVRLLAALGALLGLVLAAAISISLPVLAPVLLLLPPCAIVLGGGLVSESLNRGLSRREAQRKTRAVLGSAETRLLGSRVLLSQLAVQPCQHLPRDGFWMPWRVAGDTRDTSPADMAKLANLDSPVRLGESADALD